MADSSMLAPENPDVVARATAPVMSASERADFMRRFHARRDAAAASAIAAPSVEVDARIAAGVRGVAPTRPSEASLSRAPDTLRIGKNYKNRNAEQAANSTLAEPAAINNRNHVRAAGQSRQQRLLGLSLDDVQHAG